MRQVTLLIAFGLAACSSGGKPVAAPSAPAAAVPAATAPERAGPRVSKVVFVDKEHACECTQKAIDASWTALQTALQGVSVPVERIHLDTQEAFAAAYTDKRPMMAVPGLYFTSEGGAIVELLQGEVTVDRIREVVRR